MTFDFDAVIDRRNTESLKYDFAHRHNLPPDILPLWVADMDFRSPPEVMEALKQRCDHGIFGYSESAEPYYNAVADWMKTSYGYAVSPERLVKTPGVVFGICAAMRALTREGDAVLIQQPVYYPFADSIRHNARKLVVNRLVYEGGRYRIDFEDFEQRIIAENVRLFILCSPHNPVGRVWTREELARMGEICLRHGVIVVSDEIHADFTYPGHTHTVFGSLGEAFEQNCILCTAPTKTFNLAGLQVSNLFIADPAIRKSVLKELYRTGYGHIGAMNLIACRVAYESGRPWLDALSAYLFENLRFVREFVNERLRGVRLVEPEGTYLVWLDFSGTNKSGAELEELIVHRAKLWLDAGEMFGEGGEGFQRINIACPRAVLMRAFEALERAMAR
ncbi:MAG: MalY/PatB family protein [Bacillota bacterium]